MLPASRDRLWRSDRVAGLALALIAGVVGWQAGALPFGTLARPGPAYFPTVLAVLLGATGLLVAWRGGDALSLRDVRWPEAARAIQILLVGAFVAFAIERLGFRLTMLIVAVYLLGVVERRHPVGVGLVAVGLSFGTFYLFNNLLKVPLPLGILGF